MNTGLGIDYGTTNTVAVLRRAGAAARPLLFDGSPLLPSAVYAADDGRVVVGREAVHAARAHPERFEPHPKRSIDHGTLLLGDAEIPVEDLIEAVLRRVAEEANEAAGGPVPGPVLSYPASWGESRRSVLQTAAGRVFANPTFVPEPVAAASHVVATDAASVPVGGCVLVYDFGAGTFDATVLRRQENGFEVLATEGLPDAGGVDIDATLVAFLGAVYTGRDAATWRRLVQPSTDADRRAAAALWNDVRAAKELLSRATSTLVQVPLFDEAVPFGREQVEQLARPVLDRTVDACRAVLRAARVPPADLSALYLVGGSSRIPLVATLLMRAFGVTPRRAEEPELVVADGCLGTRRIPAVSLRKAPPLIGPRPVPTGWRRRLREPVVLGAAVLVVVVLAVVALVARDGRDRGAHAVSPSASAPGSAAPASASASPSPSSVIDACLVGTWRETENLVDFTFNGTQVQMRSSGAISRYWPDGRAVDDYGGANVSTGAIGGRHYEVVVSGTITSRLSTGNGQMFARDIVATGTIIGRVNGRESWRDPLQAAAGATSYQCRGDTLSLGAVSRNITQTRISSDPDAPAQPA